MNARKIGSVLVKDSIRNGNTFFSEGKENNFDSSPNKRKKRKEGKQDKI